MGSAVSIVLLCGVLPVAAGLLARTILRRPGRRAVIAVLAIAVLPLPFLIDPEHGIARAVGAIGCATTTVRLLSLVVFPPADPPRLVPFVAFTISPFGLIYPGATPMRRPRALVRALRGTALMLVGAVLLTIGFSRTWESFWLEHSIKLFGAFIAVTGLSEAMYAFWMTMGWRGRPMMRNFFAAPTPAEFWRRYNRPVHEYFMRMVAAPVDRRAGPSAGILASFLVSGVLHEYIAAAAIGHVTWFQMGFFGIHGLASAATHRWRPRRVMKVAAIALTLVFNVATATLFCTSVARFAGWYGPAAPEWITGE